MNDCALQGICRAIVRLVSISAIVATSFSAKPAGAGADIQVFTANIAGMAEETAEQGTWHGIALDMTDVISNEAGLSLSYQFLPWLRAQKMVLNQSQALITPLTRTPERESRYLWIVHLFDYHQVMLALFPQKPPATITEAAKLRIGVLRSSAGAHLLERLGIPYDAAETEVINARKLAAGHIDVWLVPDVVALPTLRRAQLDSQKLLVGGAVGKPESVYLAAAPSFDPLLTQRLRDAAMRATRDRKLETIRLRYQLAK